MGWGHGCHCLGQSAVFLRVVSLAPCACSLTTFGKRGPSAKAYLQTLADVACSTGVVDRGLWLRIAKQFLSCALVRGHDIVFRHYYKSIAKSAGKDYRDGAVVPFE